MLSLAQALQRRGRTGTPLPTVFPSLAAAGADICRGQLTLIVGPPSAGKSLLLNTLLAAWKLPSLAFLLDTNELTAATRFASILTGEPYKDIKSAIIGGDARYQAELGRQLPDMQAVFYAPGPEDVRLQVDAFDQRYGLPPDVVVIDNLGNQSSAYENEWATLKAMTLELDQQARRDQSAIIACHHTTDLLSPEPAERTKILGRVAQYARLVLSVNYNIDNGDFKVAVVKNTEGRTDVRAERPITLHADPERMLISEPEPRFSQPRRSGWGYALDAADGESH